MKFNALSIKTVGINIVYLVVHILICWNFEHWMIYWNDFFPEHLIELSEWGPIYTLWSNSEEELVPSLLAMSDAVDKCCQYMREVVCINSLFFFSFFFLNFPFQFAQNFGPNIPLITLKQNTMTISYW